jgi:hypothetical protein
MESLQAPPKFVPFLMQKKTWPQYLDNHVPCTICTTWVLVWTKTYVVVLHLRFCFLQINIPNSHSRLGHVLSSNLTITNLALISSEFMVPYFCSITIFQNCLICRGWFDILVPILDLALQLKQIIFKKLTSS